ncbi:MAG TPA: BON domain-containing protein [bacterium]|nr:BON domain-containing protein [bacterium]
MLNFNQKDPRDVELETTVCRAVEGMAAGLHVNAQAGHVSLSGMVDDYSTKRDISAIVRDLAGVKTLSNGIRVTPIGD